MTNMDYYQREARKTAVYPKTTEMPSGIIYCALKLAGEAGEVSEKVGKLIRDKNGILTDTDKHALLRELGDVLWYVTNLSIELGGSLEEVAQMNLTKLTSRAERGKIQGSGDNR